MGAGLLGAAAATNDWVLEYGSSLGGLPAAPVTALTQTRDGYLWVGTTNGLIRFDGHRGRPLGLDQFPGADDGFHPVALVEEPGATFWVATTEGVYRRHTNGFVRVDFFEATNAAPIRALALRRSGGVWVGTDRGLFEPANDRLRPVWRSPVTEAVGHLVESGVGLGVATTARVWLRRPEGTWQILLTNSQPTTLPLVAADRWPFLWLASPAGLWRQVGTANPHLVPFKMGTGGDYQFGGTGPGEARWLVDAAVGVVRLDAAGSAPVPGTEPSRLGPITAFTVDTLDRVWLGTAHGLVGVRRDLGPVSEPPQIQLESLHWAGNGVALDRGGGRPPLRLPAHAGGELAWVFSAPLRLPADEVRYAFRLNGANAEWTETTEPVARYTGLPAGRYVFEVRAQSARGAWGNSRTVAFELEPDFLHSTAFRTSLAIFGSGLLASFAWLRLRLRSHQGKAPTHVLFADERERIARDLHDDIGSQLAALALRADLLKRRATPELAAELDSLAGEARSVVGRMSEIIWQLNPECDTLASFGNFLATHADQWAEVTGTRFKVELPPDLPADSMCPEARRHLTLIIREALANVAKHARATETKLLLRYGPDTLFLSVQDNGRGFDLATAASTPAGSSSNGVRNQRHRAEALGGTLELRSRFGGGTRLDVVVPLTSLATGGK
jgi:signal transduction histidine kinase